MREYRNTVVLVLVNTIWKKNKKTDGYMTLIGFSQAD